MLQENKKNRIIPSMFYWQ
ncbi:hypothetical protein Godav_022081 [Gossypium davidsonii]|uniref:Uncharacterized protein n=1 Tax=Gossypium davidsonii TaxID=34287 RepID=A0A7J8TH72_GOSDV|nr:hypothetical protein [Gossypium davidsonii]